MNIYGDYIFPTGTGADSMILDFNLLSSSAGSTAMQFSPPATDLTNPNPWALGSLGSLFGANHNSDIADMGNFWARNSDGECSCHVGVTELLASMRRGGGGSTPGNLRMSLDAQLAKLKQCIVSSETSMECAHIREDSEPIHIMAVAMLIGYVIDDFKRLASESSLSMAPSMGDLAAFGKNEKGGKPMPNGATSASATSLSLGMLEPRLSWGVLELEDDDEMDLRQRLYQLSFRKLERLLSQLTLYLRDLHNARANLPDPSRHMAFVIACDYTRLWLEKKAGDVKRLFSIPGRDDAADPMLA